MCLKEKEKSPDIAISLMYHSHIACEKIRKTIKRIMRFYSQMYIK